MTTANSLPIPFTLYYVIKDALEKEPAAPRDAGVAALALRYACEIDSGGDVSRIGPMLLSALEALQMSPRSRAAAQKGIKANDYSTPKSPLDELRQRRRTRADRAATVDPTAS